MKRLLCCLLALILTLGCLAGCAASNTESATEAPITAVAEEAEITYDRAFSAYEYMERIGDCGEQVRSITFFEPEIVLFLASGLGDFGDAIEVEAEIPYAEINGFPQSDSLSHEAKLIFGTCGGKKIAVMDGAINYYDGYTMPEVVLPLRLLYLMGAKTVILTNDVGGLNADYSVGDFAVIEDHISSLIPSPLIGENVDTLGERFTDVTDVYDGELSGLVKEIGSEIGVNVHSGVMLQVTGPQYDTPAEVKMFRTLGADMVGMNGVAEAIAAKHMGMRVCGVSYITNLAADVQDEITAEQISENSDSISASFTELITTLIERMD